MTHHHHHHHHHHAQVETFGSMERREKVEIILEQMRLGLLRNDFIRTQIISKKISTKFFTEPNTEVVEDDDVEDDEEDDDDDVDDDDNVHTLSVSHCDDECIVVLLISVMMMYVFSDAEVGLLQLHAANRTARRQVG